jgi:hypothetical protein
MAYRTPRGWTGSNIDDSLGRDDARRLTLLHPRGLVDRRPDWSGFCQSDHWVIAGRRATAAGFMRGELGP